MLGLAKASTVNELREQLAKREAEIADLEARIVAAEAAAAKADADAARDVAEWRQRFDEAVTGVEVARKEAAKTREAFESALARISAMNRSHDAEIASLKAAQASALAAHADDLAATTVRAETAEKHLAEERAAAAELRERLAAAEERAHAAADDAARHRGLAEAAGADLRRARQEHEAQLAGTLEAHRQAIRSHTGGRAPGASA